MADSYHWIYATDLRKIPEWIVEGHSWHNAVPLEKLQKLQMKVRMCCSKCEEKVKEEIREVEGVFDVRAEKAKRKVVVVVTPNRGDVERKVLRKARKVDKKAKFVELDAQEKAHEKPDKDQERGHGASGEGSKKGGKAGFWSPPKASPLPGNLYNHGTWIPIPARDTPAPPHYFPPSVNRRDVTNPSQHVSEDRDSPRPIRPKPKHRSIFKKVIIWLFG